MYKRAKGQVADHMRTILPIALFIMGFAAVFLFGEQVRSGVTAGIDLSMAVLVPSLFLPIVLCSFLQQSGAVNAVGQRLNVISHKLIGLPGVCLTAFILSTVSGYPVGAVIISSLYSSQEITKDQAKKCSLFCIWAGPAFIVLGVGAMLKNSGAGVLLLAVHLLTAVTVALTVGRVDIYKDGGEMQNIRRKKRRVSITSAFVGAVYNGSKSMAIILANTVIFSALTAVFSLIPNDMIKSAVIGISEVTNAVIYFSGRLNLPLICAALGFGGLSVIAQAVSALGDIADIKRIIIVRIYSAVISFIFCKIALYFFPQTVSASASSSEVVIRASSGTMMLSVTLMAAAVVFLYSVYQRKSKRILDFFV